MAKWFLVLLALLIIPVSAMAGKSSGGGSSGTMTVQVQNAVVRSTPNYTGGSLGPVSFGTKVTVIGEEGNWYKIDSPSGWLPKSSLTKSKVNLDAAQKFSGDNNVKRDEVALAGKGFNPQVEAEFKRQNRDMAASFVTVDRIETFGATDAELRGFKAAGKL